MSRRAFRRIAGLLAGTCVLAAGLRADSPPSLDETTLNCLSTKFRGPLDPLVRKFATRVYDKKKAQIESDILRDARKTINDQFDENAAKQFAETNAKYETKVRGPMVK